VDDDDDEEQRSDESDTENGDVSSSRTDRGTSLSSCDSSGKSRSSTVTSSADESGEAGVAGMGGGGGCPAHGGNNLTSGNGGEAAVAAAGDSHAGRVEPMSLPPALPAVREEPKLYPFRVIATKSLVLYARSQAERTKWIDALMECSNPEVKSDAAKIQDQIDEVERKKQEVCLYVCMCRIRSMRLVSMVECGRYAEEMLGCVCLLYTYRKSLYQLQNHPFLSRNHYQHLIFPKTLNSK
jgi:hypothetical protein